MLFDSRMGSNSGRSMHINAPHFQCGVHKHIMLLDLVFQDLCSITLLNGIRGHLFVVAFQSCKIFSGFGELTLLHTLTHIPVDESSLAIHEIEFVAKSRPGLGDGCRVGQHADSSVDLGKITVGHHLRWLIADANLETCWAPVDELNGTLGLESGDSRVDVLGDNITSVEEAGGHVLAVSWIALDHLVVRLEAGIGDFLDAVRLVGGFGCRDDWCICDQREVNSRVGYQVGLELVEIDIEGAVEPERGSDRRND